MCRPKGTEQLKAVFMVLGREPWFSGNGMRLISGRSWIRNPSLYTGWTFFTLFFVAIIVLFVWKKTENKGKRGTGWPFKNFHGTMSHIRCNEYKITNMKAGVGKANFHPHKEGPEWPKALITSQGLIPAGEKDSIKNEEELNRPSVTRKKSPNVYNSCPKMISLEKW